MLFKLWLSVTGQFPFDGDSGMAIAEKHVDEELQYPGDVNGNLPDPVSELIVKMMAKAPEERHADPAALIVAIRGGCSLCANAVWLLCLPNRSVQLVYQ